jgi:tRNA U34 5-methylaminomethyl-2-thiouridine-forming methyltransferase MnmC
MDQDQHARIEWTDAGVPVSVRFGDPYFSKQDGLAETRHVFLQGNGLPARFGPGFRIAELGFGTGLNLLAAWQAWQGAGVAGPLRFTSFEAFPMTAPYMEQALAAFPEVAGLAEVLLVAWARGEGRIETPDLHAEIILGDARATLPRWKDKADAWFLDGFAPAQNPELWQPDLMDQVARHTAPGGTFATYTAAGFVRRGLEQSGFDVTRRPGFGRKRHMTTGRLRAGA